MDVLFNNRYRVKSARLQGWDYRNPGHYFVTINLKNREAYFGWNIDSEIILNKTGFVARKCWMDIPVHFPHALIDEFIVMPDHVHGIVVINGHTHRDAPASTRRDAACCVSTGVTDVHTHMMDMDIQKPSPGSLSAIIRSYKSAVTKKCHEMGFVQFAWQARFYDRIIWDQDELDNVRKYIRDNPRNVNV
jgi:putative transposase